MCCASSPNHNNQVQITGTNVGSALGMCAMGIMELFCKQHVPLTFIYNTIPNSSQGVITFHLSVYHINMKFTLVAQVIYHHVCTRGWEYLQYRSNKCFCSIPLNGMPYMHSFIKQHGWTCVNQGVGWDQLIPAYHQSPKYQTF